MVNNPESHPFDNVADLGIAIRTIRGEQQLHIGLLYKIDDSPALILNLRGHLELKNETPSIEYRWLQIELDEFNRRTIANLCRLIAAKSQAIPFGFTYNGSYFTLRGDYLGHDLGEGLTCATFVMALFETYSIPLLKIAEWPRHQAEDMIWQARQAGIVEARRGRTIAGAVRAHIGEPRFHPEHVTAGSVSASRPLGYEDAKRLGARIRKDLFKSYKGNPA